MIAHLKGTVTELYTHGIIVDVNGVGYEVRLPSTDLDGIVKDETVKLYTYFAVRENAQELYGFTAQNGKSLFEQLISVNGVGPKVALSILSLDTADRVAQAIGEGNVAYVQSASGVGKKGAEKIILELKDKVLTSGVSSKRPIAAGDDDVVDALEALGYSQQQIQRAVAEVDASLPSEERVRQALKGLSR